MGTQSKNRKLITMAALFILSCTSIFTSDAGNSLPTSPQMQPTKTILENTAASQKHSILVKALLKAKLTSLLASPGPFTVFAPTDAAFNKLPYGTIAALFKAENHGTLKTLLNYHVVKGRFDRTTLIQKARAAKGALALETLAGVQLSITISKTGSILMTDVQGNSADVMTYDLYQSNGIVHVIDTIMMPNS